MTIALVGGLDRLQREYESVARRCGAQLRVFTGKESCLGRKLGQPDVTIVLTNRISHNAKKIVMRAGGAVVFLHSSGVSGLLRDLPELLATSREGFS
ncbi:MAG: DUF2325 domain-containing protein [Desulfovibrio sp.]|jgi:hypothetical protein|nr:DUF2325 domain-containing protein [Desulfovibrio sp.]